MVVFTESFSFTVLPILLAASALTASFPAADPSSAAAGCRLLQKYLFLLIVLSLYFTSSLATK